MRRRITAGQELVDAADQLLRGLELRYPRGDALHVATDLQPLFRGEVAHLSESADGKLDGTREHVPRGQEVALHGCRDVYAQPFLELQRLRGAARTEGEQDRRHFDALELRADSEVVQQALRRAG
ncbi:MAG TPA: hypothetical protein VIM73_12895 [Polyangiaceae bacterium]